MWWDLFWGNLPQRHLPILRACSRLKKLRVSQLLVRDSPRDWAHKHSVMKPSKMTPTWSQIVPEMERAPLAGNYWHGAWVFTDHGMARRATVHSQGPSRAHIWRDFCTILGPLPSDPVNKKTAGSSWRNHPSKEARETCIEKFKGNFTFHLSTQFP